MKTYTVMSVAQIKLLMEKAKLEAKRRGKKRLPDSLTVIVNGTIAESRYDSAEGAKQVNLDY